MPEAQVDRFMLKLKIGYPEKKEERLILDMMAKTRVSEEINTVVTPEKVMQAREIVDEIYIDDKIKDYIVDIVFATREPKKIRFGRSGKHDTVWRKPPRYNSPYPCVKSTRLLARARICGSPRHKRHSP